MISAQVLPVKPRSERRARSYKIAQKRAKDESDIDIVVVSENFKRKYYAYKIIYREQVRVDIAGHKSSLKV